MRNGVEVPEFMGYVRADGSVGVRNYVVVVPTVVCSVYTAIRIASRIPGAVSFYHEHGCGVIGPDYQRTRRTLIGMGTNPNVAAALVVGLGCEQVTVEDVADEIAASRKPVRALKIQDCCGVRNTIREGRKLLRDLVAEAAKAERVPVRADRLILGTECGGSDAMSGVSANPSVGVAVDRLIEMGGRAILSETPEFIGAEHLLAERERSGSGCSRVLEIVGRVEVTASSAGEDIRGAQPSPGNMAGGLTTLEEKSLGCIWKGGTTPIRSVIDYSERVTEPGLTVMDTTGDDVRSVSGMVAGGAQIIVFTTGRGTPVGCPIAPVIKIASNTRTYREMLDCIDINAGTVVEGSETTAQVGQRIIDYVLRVASGKKTKAERLGQNDFAIDRLLPTL